MAEKKNSITINRIKRKHKCNGNDCQNDSVYSIKTDVYKKYSCESCYDKLCGTSPLLAALRDRF